LQRVGFGQRTESGYPGESDGSIVNVKDANPFVLGTVSFGYGMSVTALQLAKAYLIFANEGRLKPVTLLHNENEVVGEQVLDKKTAKQVLAMLEAVLGNGGTGRSARVPGYRVAGKTGTAQIAGKNGYEKHRHIASFVGIAPVSNPRFVVAVVIHEPTKNGYYAASVAAPLFAQVMSGTLRILDVPPDQTTT
ncbi:penicillin-binding transpeptidase domain-containing protein, partial [Legionella sp.]